ncbi:Vesicle-associated membrane protein 7 [Manis javanica]|nr:Vesicle-associated membrane protein 7 [Manis javanica]
MLFTTSGIDPTCGDLGDILERSHSQEAARRRGALRGSRWRLVPSSFGSGQFATSRRYAHFSSESARSQRVPGQIEVMAILFAVVARGTTILAKHAWCGGNFLEVTEQILAKIPSENNKLTYSHGNYLFHYICQDRIVYLCITDDDFERSRAFNFLNEIRKRFQTTYGSRAQTALPYAMNSEFSSVLAAQLKHHSENKGLDKVMETQAQVDELKGIMVRNIDLVAQRGERLELLIDKTENLMDSSVTFKTTSRNLARAMCMKNLKLTIIVIIVSVVFIYIIVSPLCEPKQNFFLESNFFIRSVQLLLSLRKRGILWGTGEERAAERGLEI